MLKLTLVTLAILACATSAVLGQEWKCTAETTAEICKGAGQAPAVTVDSLPVGRCTQNYFRVNDLANIKEQFNQCADDGTTCCTDPCTLQLDVQGCLGLMLPDGSSTRCSYMPYSGSRYNCVSKWKLCLRFSNSVAECQRNVMCEMNNASTPPTCIVKPRFQTEQAAATATLDECPALHGVVIAFLVLMFISLVGAIVFVIVVVIYKQKKADEEERKAKEEQEAAEAAAKAQQEDAADF
jgi:hypothetical protein